MKMFSWSRTVLLSFMMAAECLAAAAQLVVVTSPTNDSSVVSPVHYVASASSPQCSRGIASMRIYIADHVVAYKVEAAAIDTLLTLVPGNYATVVQAWDNCGGVGKSAVNITVTPTGVQPARFLYIANRKQSNVLGFEINPTTGVPSPTAQRVVNLKSSWRLAADHNGNRLYLTGGPQIYAFFIDRRNGYLSPVPGSPFPLDWVTDSAVVHPSGKFVFVSTAYATPDGILVFRVNPNGSLTQVNAAPIPTKASTRTLVVDRYGQYLYAMAADGNSVDGFEINTTSGALTPVPGSPYFPIAPPDCLGYSPALVDMIDSFGRLYITELFAGFISGYASGGNTGVLTELAGSPFLFRGGCPNGGWPLYLTSEPSGRFLYVNASFGSATLYAINAGNGGLTAVRDITLAPLDTGYMRVDPSGKFLYISNNNHLLDGFSIDQITGNLTQMPGAPFTVGSDPGFFDLAVTP